MTDLPHVLRWTASRKQRLVTLVANGEITAEDAARFYSISVEEFAAWQRDYPARQAEHAR